MSVEKDKTLSRSKISPILLAVSHDNRTFARKMCI